MECYFDNAATTALCFGAKSAIERSLDCYGNPSSLHSLGVQSSVLVDSVRKIIAENLMVTPEEVYFTSGGTESDNIAILGAARALKRRGNRIVTTAFEHSAVLNTMKQLEKEGFEVIYLKPNESGTVEISEFISAINKETILVSCMSVNNETGAFLPVSLIKKCIQNSNSPALFHCDATQSFMKYPIYPKTINCDLMTVSSHKIHGPKGVGALYIKKGVRILPHTYGGSQEKGLRPGTEPTILIGGFGAAVNDFGDMEQNKEKAKEIKSYIISNLCSFDDIVINSPEKSSDYILNLSVIGVRSETMLHFLEQREIYVSSGSACSKGKASHVLNSLGFDKMRSDSAIRISFSKFSTIDQAKILIQGILDAKSNLIKSK